MGKVSHKAYWKQLCKAIEVTEQLSARGQALAGELFGPEGKMGLREAARATGLSPSYLSLVLNGKTVCSLGAYERLVKLL